MMAVIDIAAAPLDNTLIHIDTIDAVTNSCRLRERSARLDLKSGRLPGLQPSFQNRHIVVPCTFQFFSGGTGGQSRTAVIIDNDTPVVVRHALRDPVQKDHLVDTGISGTGNMPTGKILRQKDIYQGRQNRSRSAAAVHSQLWLRS